MVFRVLTAARRGFYKAGVFRRKILPRPVVSIGNISLGGGGKTPMVIYLARMAIGEGKKPAVLTRGYGRRDRLTRMVEPSVDWREVGDEPLLISKALPGVPVVVSKDRHQGGVEVLRRKEVDFFILDDGFSHHPLKKDLEVVVVDDRRRFGNGRIFPSGILREPRKRLRDAGVVIVTKAAVPDEGFLEEISGFTEAPVLWADFRPVSLVPVGNPGKLPQSTSDGPFLGFCGIADPEAFRISLERSGTKILDLLAFPDHHPYTSSDVGMITEMAAKIGARALVTTEKDAIRWPGKDSPLPCFALSMEVVFLEGEGELREALRPMVD